MILEGRKKKTKNKEHMGELVIRDTKADNLGFNEEKKEGNLST